MPVMAMCKAANMLSDVGVSLNSFYSHFLPECLNRCWMVIFVPFAIPVVLERASCLRTTGSHVGRFFSHECIPFREWDAAVDQIAVARMLPFPTR